MIQSQLFAKPILISRGFGAVVLSRWRRPQGKRKPLNVVLRQELAFSDDFSSLRFPRAMENRLD
jgi:hypothetical protein